MKLLTICENGTKLSPWVNPDYMHGDNFAESTTFIYTERTGLLTDSGNKTHYEILWGLNYGDGPYSEYAEQLLALSREKHVSIYLEIAVNGRCGSISYLCEKWGRRGKQLPIDRSQRGDIDKFLGNLPDDFQDGECAGYLVSIWRKNKFLTKCMDELYKQKIISDPVYISTPSDSTQLWRNRSMVPMNRAGKVSSKQSSTGLFPGQKWWAMQSENKNI